MKDYSEYIGKKFGRLTILSLTDDYVSPCGVHQPRVICKCGCGKEKSINLLNIIRGKTKSCGCILTEIRKEMVDKNPYSPKKYKRLHRIYDNMITRCYNRKAINYERYGGKGVIVTEEWMGTCGRKNFIKWSLANGYDDNLTIDRIDNNNGYSPLNCRWVSVYMQANNKTNNRIIEIDGICHTLAEWSRISGINAETIRKRLQKYGFSKKDAVFLPLLHNRK